MGPGKALWMRPRRRSPISSDLVWCCRRLGRQLPTCVALAPHMASIASANPELMVVKLDASKARRLCMSLQVRGLPTILLFSDGEEVARISEPNLNADQVDAWLASALEKLPTAPNQEV